MLIAKNFPKYFNRLFTLQLKSYILQDRKGLRTIPILQQKQIEKIDNQIFTNESIKLLIRLKQAFTKMKDYNQQIIKQINLTYNPDPTLQVQSQYGQIKIQGHIQTSTLFYTSPFTGIYKYYYDLKQFRWFSNKDNHIFQENISRQMMYKFKGVFQL